MPVTELQQQVDPAAPPIDSESQAAELLAYFAKIQSMEVRAAILTLVTGLSLR